MTFDWNENIYHISSSMRYFRTLFTPPRICKISIFLNTTEWLTIPSYFCARDFPASFQPVFQLLFLSTAFFSGISISSTICQWPSSLPFYTERPLRPLKLNSTQAVSQLLDPEIVNKFIHWCREKPSLFLKAKQGKTIGIDPRSKYSNLNRQTPQFFSPPGVLPYMVLTLGQFHKTNTLATIRFLVDLCVFYPLLNFECPNFRSDPVSYKYSRTRCHCIFTVRLILGFHVT